MDLVDHDLPARSRGLSLDLLPKQLGPCDITPELLGLEQIDPAVVAVGLPQERALARLPRPPEKEGLGPRRRKPLASREHLLQFIMMK